MSEKMGIDLTGKVFGKLTVTKNVGSTSHGQRLWECLCDCGKTTIATTSTLQAKDGGKRSCGCLAFRDLTGQRFGMLLVIKRVENNGPRATWLCQCDCGNQSRSWTQNLLNGLSTSCGCVRTKHSGRKMLLYKTWTSMKTRCRNPKSPSWERYGGRGIRVCEEWLNDFGSFKDWALSHKYEEGLSIDRIENDGNYCPKNCQWLTLSDNAKKARADQKRKNCVA